MTVFKSVLLHFWRYKWVLLAFTGIFFVLAIMFSQTAPDEFSMSSMEIQVVDHSDDTVSNGLIENLSIDNNVEVVEKTRAELQEEILVLTSDGVIIIEENLEERFIEGNADVEIIVDSRIAASFQLENLVNKYFRYLDAENSAGGSINPDKVNEIMSSSVNIELVDTGESIIQSNYSHLQNYMNFMGYVMLLLITIVGGNVMTDINKPEINNRIKVSPIKSISYSIQTISAQLVVTFFMVAIFLAFAYVLRNNQLDGVPITNMLLAALTIPLLGLSILHLLNAITNNKFIINGVANFVIIGMAFLSGIFIPFELFGEGVRQIAMFMPLYHYTEIYGDIEMTIVDALPSVSIVVLFSISLIILGTIIRRNRRMET